MTRNSKDKLNAFHLAGSIGVGIVVAVASESWLMFALVTAALIVAGLITGEIRPPRPRK